MVRSRPITVALAILVVAVLPSGPGRERPADAASGSVDYRAPTDAPVIDGFRPPERDWMPGNRGVDFGTEVGDPVQAAADGRVLFAGPVGGVGHVTIEHNDGLRTSYSFLAVLSVVAGAQVRRGEVIGIAGGPFHFGVRTPDDRYLDPQALLAGTLRPRVALVPGTEEGADPLSDERRSLMRVVLDRGAAIAGHLGARVAGWSELALHYRQEISPMTRWQRASDAVNAWLGQRGTCTPSSVPTPRLVERRLVVLVSGLGTTSDGNSAWSFRTESLGYAPTDVIRFSYAGGQAPPPPGGRVVAGVGVNPFDSVDSQQHLGLSADRLRALLGAVAAAHPGVPIDVLAHSQGGVVSRLALSRAASQGSLPSEVRTLVTAGTPHDGAPLATAVELMRRVPDGDASLTVIRESGQAHELDHERPAIGDLAESSALISELQRTPMPSEVRAVALGASGDLVVPGGIAANLAPSDSRILPSSIGTAAHGDLPNEDRTTREIALAVNGMPLGCQSLGEAVRSFATAEAVRVGQAGAALAAAGISMSPAAQLIAGTGSDPR